MEKNFSIKSIISKCTFKKTTGYLKKEIPKTFDSIVNYIIIGVVSFIIVVGIVIYFVVKKESKK